jgi:hypothetical protein
MNSNYALGNFPQDLHSPAVPIPSVHLPVPDMDTRSQAQRQMTMQLQAQQMQDYLAGFLGNYQQRR